MVSQRSHSYTYSQTLRPPEHGLHKEAHTQHGQLKESLRPQQDPLQTAKLIDTIKLDVRGQPWSADEGDEGEKGHGHQGMGIIINFVYSFGLRYTVHTAPRYTRHNLHQCATC